jgi:DNA-binding NarL/FixJ family response regulator
MLGEERFAAALEHGRTLGLGDAIDEAAAVAQELVQGLGGGRADEAVAARPSPVASPSTIPDPGSYGLSPREHEILVLLAQRWSDKEIAESLFISPRTVMTHVTHIFAKMGVANRREAAAAAARHGLI